jgi:NAD(P)-dependent dehydrogenase (short-subunit alcohol dehydrogenase family)
MSGPTSAARPAPGRDPAAARPAHRQGSETAQRAPVRAPAATRQLPVAGRRVLVSGGTSGIGLACARRLAANGAAVFVLGSRNETLDAALAQAPALAGAACDVCDEPSLTDAVARAVDHLGALDAVLVNAGIDGAGVPGCELDAAFFRRVLDVNVIGAFLVARACLPLLERPGTLLFNASVNALRPERNFLDYNASKAAVVSMAKTFALELGGAGLTVIALCPGYFPTRMTAPYLDDPATRAELVGRIPAGRIGDLEELAALVEFLLGPNAGFLHGSVVSIDGGASI